MKKFLVMAALATSTTAFAAEIYDIMYLPKAGTTYGITEGEYLKRSVEGKSGVADTDVDGYLVTQAIGHSFTDRFLVQASLGYGDFNLDEDGSDKTEQNGISDPSVAARFRVMDEAFQLDVLGEALISLGDTEVESNGDTDNYQGGHALVAGAQIGAKTGSMQWALLATYRYNFERTYDTSGGDVDGDPNQELLLRADLLNKLAEKSFLRTFVSADFSEALEGDDDAEFSAPSTLYTVGAEYQHLCTKDLLARFGVDYAMNNSNSGSIDSDRSWTFRVAANYQF